jgi:hypothetical protein
MASERYIKFFKNIDSLDSPFIASLAADVWCVLGASVPPTCRLILAPATSKFFGRRCVVYRLYDKHLDKLINLK